MAKPNPLSPVVTLADPPLNSLEPVYAQQKGTIQWRTESRNYPTFSITFQGPNPADGDPNKTFPAGSHGDKMHPVVIAANTIKPVNHNDPQDPPYKYTIQQTDTTGAVTTSQVHTLYVSGCPYC